MRKTRTRSSVGRAGWLALISSLLLIWSAPQAAAPEARAIIDGVYKQDTSRDTRWQASMEVYDRKGTARRKKFQFYKLGGLGNSRTLIRFQDPAEVRGVGLLSINQVGTGAGEKRGAGDRQWMYTPAIQRVRRIAAQERRQRFLGTDFTNEDMAERVLEDFQYKLLLEREMIDGRPAYKIEARPISPDRSQYAYLYLWVPHDIPYATIVEMYDRQGQLLRVLRASQLEQLSGIWIARRLEMRSPVENTRTVLQVEEVRFNTGLKADLFTQQALERDVD
jgi:hypothetical protein